LSACVGSDGYPAARLARLVHLAAVQPINPVLRYLQPPVHPWVLMPPPVGGVLHEDHALGEAGAVFARVHAGKGPGIARHLPAVVPGALCNGLVHKGLAVVVEEPGGGAGGHPATSASPVGSGPQEDVRVAVR